jgi:hypothetical protein
MLKSFNKLEAKTQWIIGIITLVLLAIAVYYIYKKVEAKRVNNIIDGTTQTANVNGAPVQVNIGTRASEIYDALHSSWYSEDEVKAVNAVLQVPKALIPNLSQVYFTISGKNLKTDLQYYLSNEQWLSIQSQFN